MLCPEIWNFTPPKSTVLNKTCASNEEIVRTIRKQIFNHKVSVTMPNYMTIPEEVKDVLADDSRYYRINGIPVREIFNPNFIDLFVKNGQLTVISVNTISNRDDSIACVSNGKFILSLSTKSIQEVGLEPNNNLKRDSGSLVIFDAALLCENHKKCQEIENKLSKVDLMFDVVLVWEPNDSKVCPSTIAYYFSKKGYKVKTCDVKVEQRLSYNVSVPIYDDNTDPDGLLEWLGAFNLQCNLSSENLYISSYNYLEETENFGQVSHISFTGLFTTRRIERLINEIWNLVHLKPSSWIGVVINGFEGSLLSFKNGNSFHPIGDHHHTIIMKSGTQTLVSFFQQ